MPRFFALLLSLLVLTFGRVGFAQAPAPGTLTIWPVPALALTPGLTITVDGTPLPIERLGKPLVVGPGEHVIRATAPGREPSETIVGPPPHDNGGFVILDTLRRTRAPSFEPQPKAAPPSTPAAPATSASEPAPALRIAGYALVGVGLAGATAGLAVVFLAPESSSSAEEERERAAWATTAVGGATLLAGIVMAIAAPDEVAPPTSPKLAAWATPTSAGATLTATF